MFLLLLEDAPSWLERIVQFFETFHYLGPFTVLMACGLGAPLPEEVTLIGCGYLMYKGIVQFIPVTLLCSGAILLGDSIPYWLGRHYGLRALRSRLVARVLHPERFAELERKFERNGNWAVFTCRFLPMFRIPGYFVAGTMRMTFPRFLLLDTLGVLISVPTSIWFAYFVFTKIGDELKEAQKRVSAFNHWILAAVVLLVVGYFLYRRLRKKRASSVKPSANGDV